MKKTGEHFTLGEAAPDEKINVFTDIMVYDKEASYDNKASFDRYLDMLNIPQRYKDLLLIPWRNGYYQMSDGKSHPIPSLRLSRRLKVMGLKLDPPSVLHDWMYYAGNNRKQADDLWYRLSVVIGMPKWAAFTEWSALRMFGWKAYNAHKKKRQTIADYGTVFYIEKQIGVYDDEIKPNKFEQSNPPKNIIF